MPRPAPSMPGTSGPQLRLEAALRAAGVAGWEREPADLGPARPDVFFRHTGSGIAVYVDGCAWHGCPAHWRPHPKEGHGLSRAAMLERRFKDGLVVRALEAKGIKVVRIWEHEIRADADACARRVRDALAPAPASGEVAAPCPR